MNLKERITAQPVTLTGRQIIPILERTARLASHGGWYMTRVCSIRIEENGKIYDYPLIPSSPDQEVQNIDVSGNADSQKP